jgi:hypothetical protein
MAVEADIASIEANTGAVEDQERSKNQKAV